MATIDPNALVAGDMVIVVAFVNRLISQIKPLLELYVPGFRPSDKAHDTLLNCLGIVLSGAMLVGILLSQKQFDPSLWWLYVLAAFGLQGVAADNYGVIARSGFSIGTKGFSTAATALMNLTAPKQTAQPAPDAATPTTPSLDTINANMMNL